MRRLRGRPHANASLYLLRDLGIATARYACTTDNDNCHDLSYLEQIGWFSNVKESAMFGFEKISIS